MSPAEAPLPGFDGLVTKAKRGDADQKKIIWVSAGSVKVPIYQLKGRFCVAYLLAKRGKRIRLTRVSLNEAKEAARQVCMDILRGQVSAGPGFYMVS